MALEGPIGERIALYRRRRGLSQRQLAGLIHRSESWLSQVERGIRSVDKLSVLIDIAKVLHVKVETLAGQPFSLAPNGEPDLDGMAAIEDALSAYPSLGVTTPPAARLTDIGRMTTEVHLRYQSADYAAAARILPSLIKSVDWLVVETHGDERRRALELQSSVYVAAAKLVTKVGNGELARLTADRAATAALHADSPTLGAAAAYQVACAFLKNDRLEEAENIAVLSRGQPRRRLTRRAVGPRRPHADLCRHRRPPQRPRRGNRTPPARAGPRRAARRGRQPRLDRVRTHERRHPPRLGGRRAGRRPDGDRAGRARRRLRTAERAPQPACADPHRHGVGLHPTPRRRRGRHQPHGSRASRTADAALQRPRARAPPRDAQARAPDGNARPSSAVAASRSPPAVTDARPVVYVIGFSAPPVLHLQDFVTQLKTDGWDPYVVLSPTAASWVDVDLLRSASGHAVRVEPRTPAKQDPLPPAAAMIAAPLTFNSLNKWAAGISDTLALGLLNEALGLDLPIIGAPCVKAALRRHPAYPRSIKILTAAGVDVRDPDAIVVKTPRGALTLDWQACIPYR